MVDVQLGELPLVDADLVLFLGLYNPGLHFLPCAIWEGRLQRWRGGGERQSVGDRVIKQMLPGLTDDSKDI